MMSQVLQSFFKKAATTTYPFGVKKEMPKNFRGQLRFFPEKCICCKLCMRDCPSEAISIKKVGEGKMEAEIDLSRCIYCGQCVDVCPKKALESTPEFELAQVDRGKLKVVFGADDRKDTKTKT
jgi:formate hydrogenlyase subunit 6/NADH:ubiquinone oxidoreductase subunit I